jgi:hypothetical protein
MHRKRRRGLRASSQQNYDDSSQEKFDCDMRAHPSDAAREQPSRLAQQSADEATHRKLHSGRMILAKAQKT